nr:oligosaccharide flippase family protein [Sandaracinobacteroides sayramensis]
MLNLLFLPLYDHLLGPAAFGAVAMVLAFQSFFLVFDFGLAILLGTDVAAAGQDRITRSRCAAQWRCMLALALGAGLAAAVLLFMAGQFFALDGFRPADLSTTALLIAGAIAANAGQAALIADHAARAASSLQFAGALLRGLFAWLVLQFVAPGISGFLLSQLLVLAMHLLLLDRLLLRRLGPAASGFWRPAEIHRLWERARPLIAYSLAGAMAMQIDKPLVAAFFSLEIAGRWFLAVTYALTPIALLAGPLHQFFYPRLVQAAHDPEAALGLGRLFQAATVLAVTAPGLVLATEAPLLIRLWLPHAEDSRTIAAMAMPIVAATTVGAMGYLPTAWLVGTGDRAWIARLSWLLLLLLLTGLLLAGAEGSMPSFVAAYCAFHLLGCGLLWRRMLRNWPAARSRSLLFDCWLLPAILLSAALGLILWALQAMNLPDPARLFVLAAAGGGLTLPVAWRLWLRYGNGLRMAPLKTD